MEKSGFRVLIKHFFKLKKIITETKKVLDKWYTDSALSIKIIHKVVQKTRLYK